ncbi:histidine phosphatase family protein [Microbacterium sp.]|uniref:histidine phosphatase family protein n=1 Tax=Microbacterium sp. TaxID=51671 RepID=UPI0039E5874D
MTTLTLVRHGETDWNRDRRIQGATDIPLNDDGRAQARAAAQRLRDQLPTDAPIVVACSDLSRAHETARLVAEGLAAAAPRVYPGLRERGYGAAEGMTTTDFFARWGDWHTADIPDAEPWAALRARAVATIRRVVRDARRQTAPVGPAVVVVTHGALIREVIRHATGGAFPSPAERLPNGSAHTLLVERDRLRLLDYAAAPPA